MTQHKTIITCRLNFLFILHVNQNFTYLKYSFTTFHIAIEVDVLVAKKIWNRFNQIIKIRRVCIDSAIIFLGERIVKGCMVHLFERHNKVYDYGKVVNKSRM